jgi:DNA-directed RNA polymerase subunit RPC12/RpoP
MDAISVRCKNCKHPMKFSADKAGKRAKCPKCQAIVLVKVEEEPAQQAEEEPAKKEPALEAMATPVVQAVDPDDDGPAAYDVFTDPELEERKKEIAAEEEARLKQKKDKKKLPKMTRKMKAIPDAEAWAKVRLGLLFTFIGVCIWIASHIVQGSYVLLGSVEFPEYANLVASNLDVRGGEDDLPAPGRFWEIDEVNLYLGMIAGRDFANYAKICLTIASVLYFFQAIAWGIGYVIALPVPRRFGAFGQLLAGMVLAVFNFIFMFFFKLLPVVGILGYVLIPLLTPELPMTEYNMERIIPIQIMFSSAPFWENFLNLIIQFALYLQPALGCIFIWSVGVAIKDDTVAQGGKGRTQMCLGTFFILICYHVLSLCGASPVLVLVLRVFYTVWFCFLLLFLLQYMMLILKVRAVLYDKINPKNELQD